MLTPSPIPAYMLRLSPLLLGTTETCVLQATAEERRLEARLAEMRDAQAAMLLEAVSTAEVMERLVVHASLFFGAFWLARGVCSCEPLFSSCLPRGICSSPSNVAHSQLANRIPTFIVGCLRVCFLLVLQKWCRGISFSLSNRTSHKTSSPKYFQDRFRHASFPPCTFPLPLPLDGFRCTLSLKRFDFLYAPLPCRCRPRVGRRFDSRELPWRPSSKEFARSGRNGSAF